MIYVQNSVAIVNVNYWRMLLIHYNNITGVITKKKIFVMRVIQIFGKKKNLYQTLSIFKLRVMHLYHAAARGYAPLVWFSLACKDPFSCMLQRA